MADSAREAKTGGVTLDDLLARARDMVPVLRERAAATEKLRRIPDETVAEFVDAGFYRIYQPERFGGFELDYGDQVVLSAELGRGCASSAWDASVVACHAWILGMFPLRAQEDVWADDPATLVSTSFMPIDPEVKRVDGGYTISGRWRFSSGVDHCKWTIILVPVPPEDGDGPPERHFALAPLSGFEIDDNWYVTGLSGTGSKDIVTTDTFIPDYRSVPVTDLRDGRAPGCADSPAYIYRLPLMALFPYNLLGPCIGSARGALETVIEAVKTRVSHSTRAQVGQMQSAHLRIAEAGSEIDAAMQVALGHTRVCGDIVRNGGLLTGEQRVRCRRDTAYAALMCVRAVDRLFPLLGGQGLSLDHATQRMWRDVHAISQHIGLTWDVHGSAYGAVAVGNPPDPNL